MSFWCFSCVNVCGECYRKHILQLKYPKLYWCLIIPLSEHYSFMQITVNSMVLFSCKLVGCTLVERATGSVVLALEISGERPFSSRPCRLGKLGFRLNGTGRVPVAELPNAPLPIKVLPSPLDWKFNALLSPSTNPPPFPPLSVLPESCS